MIVDWPHKQQESFQRTLSLFVHLLENFLEGHPSKYYFNSRTLNYEVLIDWATKNKMHLIFGSPYHKKFTPKHA